MRAGAHRSVHRETADRLRWWSLALPAAAFAALLALTLSSGGGHAAGARPVTHLLARIAQLLPG